MGAQPVDRVPGLDGVLTLHGKNFGAENLRKTNDAYVGPMSLLSVSCAATFQAGHHDRRNEWSNR